MRELHRPPQANGFTLIEVIITMGITVFALLAIANMMESQDNMLKIMNQRLDIVDLKRSITNTLSKSSACTFNFNGKAINLSGALTASSRSNHVVNLGTLYEGDSATSAVLANVNGEIGTNKVRVSAVRFTNFYRLSPNQFSGELQVMFDTSSLVQATPNISLTQTISTTADSGVTTITGCGGSSGSSGSSVPVGPCPGSNVDPARPWLLFSYICPSGARMNVIGYSSTRIITRDSQTSNPNGCNYSPTGTVMGSCFCGPSTLQQLAARLGCG